MLSCQKLDSSKSPSINLNLNTHQVKNISSSYRRFLSFTPVEHHHHRHSSIRFLSISLKSLHDSNASSSLSSSLPFASSSPHFTSSVGSPPPHLSHWNLTSRHITLLNLMACSVAVSATWLFCSAIPTLLAFKRAAESLEKLLDVAREELPGTMAALRLSGMEISDLTMELSDLGQEITKGVKSSTRAVRVAKERLHQLTNMTPSGGQSES